MSEICTKCGLPKELCVCETIAKENQTIIVKIEKRKFGKRYTIISGIDETEVDIKSTVKKLKTALACGGTAKNKKIELQGNHKPRIKQALIKIGFEGGSIKIK